MWDTSSLWVETFVVTLFYLLGNVFLGHFDERNPIVIQTKLKKLLKYVITLIIVLLISTYFNRSIAFVVLGLTIVPVLYIHCIVLPKKGINGFTGEPKSKYYEFRGWHKDTLDKDE